MIKFFPFLLFITLALGCQRTVVTQRSASANFDSARVGSTPSQPTTIKQNVSLIEAVIDSITLVDDVQYRLSAQVRSANPVEGMASLAEAGQHILASAQYLQTQDGSIDYTNGRNKNLLALRSAKPGDVFTGKVALNAYGRWILVEVIEQ